MTETRTKHRLGTTDIRHNGYGVDVVGSEEAVHRVMGALNAHADLLEACKAIDAISDEVPAPAPAEAVFQMLAIARAAIAKAEGGAA